MKSIAVYCSSSNKVDDIYKEEAEKVGNLLAKKGIGGLLLLVPAKL